MLDIEKEVMDKDSAMLMSLCIPVYNSEKTIEHTVNSILKSRHTNIEIVLFYDKSTDSTLDIIQKMTDKRIRIICNPHKMNYGRMLLECGNNCRGKYLMYVIDRNYLSSQMLDEFLDFIEEREDVVCGMCSPIKHHTYKICQTTVEKINVLGYQGQHITGNFFETQLFKQLMAELKNVNYGNFPLDFLFAMACLKGNGLLYNEIYQSESDYISVACCKTKSSTNGVAEWFRPLGQVKYLGEAIKHVNQLGISRAEKKEITKHIYKRIKVQATLGYKEILTDSRFCGHYNIEPEYMGVYKLVFWRLIVICAYTYYRFLMSIMPVASR